jgi:hypothetical protein
LLVVPARARLPLVLAVLLLIAATPLLPLIAFEAAKLVPFLTSLAAPPPARPLPPFIPASFVAAPFLPEEVPVSPALEAALLVTFFIAITAAVLFTISPAFASRLAPAALILLAAHRVPALSISAARAAATLLLITAPRSLPALSTAAGTFETPFFIPFAPATAVAPALVLAAALFATAAARRRLLPPAVAVRTARRAGLEPPMLIPLLFMLPALSAALAFTLPTATATAAASTVGFFPAVLTSPTGRTRKVAMFIPFLLASRGASAAPPAARSAGMTGFGLLSALR